MADPHDQRHPGLPPRSDAGACETMSQFSRPMRDNARKVSLASRPISDAAKGKVGLNGRNNPSVAEVVDADRISLVLSD
ncbi:uncharacterized protein An07g03900 [Aspergillus niger]|uniref:Contig An07c0100, genomic contig n=2 Tax=Aspergillus niger TaxID=5061 RepID=A2QMZ9_ASPNC|nr:uncharacterized protein An07g03900 [Aspergillus niger]CAK48140.1 unnamed protein product [Aspergillus niger]